MGKKSKNKMNTTLVIVNGIILFVFFIIFMIMYSIGAKSMKVENKTVKDTYIENEQMLSKFMELGYEQEKAQEFVNILGSIKVTKINEITNKEYSTDFTKNEKLPKENEYDVIYECEGNNDIDGCNFLIFIKDNEIICVCYNKAFDYESDYDDYHVYYTNVEGRTRGAVISWGDATNDWATTIDN